MTLSEVKALKYTPAPEGAEMTAEAAEALEQQRRVAERISVAAGVRVTPQMAAEWMENNAGNRNISKNTVNHYKAKAKEGAWQYNSATIAFDLNDRLIDGQHRLLACLQTGIPFYTTVLRGLDPLSQDVTDRGKPRTLGGQLAARNEENYEQLGSILRTYWRVIRHRLHWTGGSGASGAYGQASRMDVDDGIALFETDPVGFRETVLPASQINRKLRVSTGLVGALYYAFSSVDAEDNEFFWAFLKAGSDMEESHPIQVLREKLIKDMAKTPEQRISDTRKAAYIIKAWRHYMNGEQISDLRWYPGGSKQEAFPLIEGFEGYLYAARPRRKPSLK